MAKDYTYYYSSAAYELQPQRLPDGLPEKQPQQHKQPELRKVKMTVAQARAASRASDKRLLKAAAPVALMFAVLITFCASVSSADAGRRSLDEAKSRLDIYQSSHRQLEAELAKLVSVDKIEKIAVDKLGMLKATDENTIYINIADKNEIIRKDADNNSYN